MPMRPASSTCSALTKPCPSTPSSCASGTRQFSKMTSLVSLARMPSLSSFLPARKPGRAALDDEGRDAARALGRASVTAIDDDQVAVAAVGDELLGAVDAPSRRRRARPSCASPPRRCPTTASVSAHAASCSPRASGTQIALLLRLGAEHGRCARRRARCARRPTGRPPDRRAPAPRCRCSSRPTTSPRRRTPRETGCPSGRGSAQLRRRTSRGKCCASSHSRTCGRSSASANSRTLRLSSSCSSVRRKSMPRADRIIGVCASPARSFSPLAACSRLPARAAPTPRSSSAAPARRRLRQARGFAVGGGILVLGFEFEYSDTREGPGRRRAVAADRHGQHPAADAGRDCTASSRTSRPAPAAIASRWTARARPASAPTPAAAVKMRLAGSAARAVRLPRVPAARRAALPDVVHRFYAGANLAF